MKYSTLCIYLQRFNEIGDGKIVCCTYSGRKYGGYDLQSYQGTKRG